MIKKQCVRNTWINESLNWHFCAFHCVTEELQENKSGQLEPSRERRPFRSEWNLFALRATETTEQTPLKERGGNMRVHHRSAQLCVKMQEKQLYVSLAIANTAWRRS